MAGSIIVNHERVNSLNFVADEERSGQPPRCRTAEESYFDPK